MFDAHVAWELDEKCDSIYGGVFEDHPVDCFVCNLIDTTVENYYESVHDSLLFSHLRLAELKCTVPWMVTSLLI